MSRSTIGVVPVGALTEALEGGLLSEMRTKTSKCSRLVSYGPPKVEVGRRRHVFRRLESEFIHVGNSPLSLQVVTSVQL